MNLAADLVATLGKENVDLADALVKTRILASRLGNKQLADWCRFELSGYPSGAEVPPYRKISLTLVGTVSNGAYQHPNRALPLRHLTQEQRDHFTKRSVTEGVSAIQSWIGKDVATHFPIDMGFLFKPILQETYQIESLVGRPAIGAHEQILVEIRSRLLEFALEVQDTLPADENLAKPVSSEMNEKITTLLNGSVYGNNNVIQIGHGNVAKVSHGIAAGDLAALVDVLRKSGLSEEDTQELTEAIRADGDEPSQIKRLGARVKEWVGKALGKAVAATWTIGTTAAASLLTSALGAYYGFQIV